jgi:hypothetical protein
MWCKVCRQDVPALPKGERQTLCCSRCGEAVGAAAVPRQDAAADQPPTYDGWELDEQLAHIERSLKAGRLAEPRGPVDYTSIPRFDAPQAGPPSGHLGASQHRQARRRLSDRQKALSGTFAWVIVSLGTMSLVCGGALLVWSLATGRQELWNVGLPAAVAGQIALLAGLVLQIDRLWYDNRRAAAKLGNVEGRLRELQTTAMMLGTGQSPASTTFYSHFASGAAPQLLLTDLKSQLDLLAVRMAQEE